MSLDKFLKSAKKIQEDRKQNRSAEGPKPEMGHDEGNWLMSYADMMTLLCGFFILLFSMAKLDQPKYEKMKQEVAKEFHGEYVNKPQMMADHLTEALREINVHKGVEVRPDAAGVQIVFESTLFFDTLSSDVRPEGREVLAHLIDSVAQLQKKEATVYRVVVEGHTDSRPITAGLFPSNWELSSARAARVVRLFIDRGFAADRLAAVGYADTRPVAPSRTPAGQWDDSALAKNRRVVVRILEPRIESIPLADHADALIPLPATGDPAEIPVKSPASENPPATTPAASTAAVAPAGTAAVVPARTPAATSP